MMPVNYSRIKFWNATDATRQWDYSLNRDGATPIGLQSGQSTVKAALDNTYAQSPYAAALIDKAIAFLQDYQQTLNFARDSAASSDNAAKFNKAADSWISIQLGTQAKVYAFNTSGTPVQEPLALTLFHEISHASVISSNPDPVSSSEVTMNAAIYDYRGPAVKDQNAIALELGHPENEVASYQGTMVDGVTFWSDKIEKGYSYTDGQHVDVVRMGVDTADTMDHSGRKTTADQPPKDLFFGFGGDDTLNGGTGMDFLYGGEGGDTIHGGDGNDFIYGDGDYYHQTVAGDDILYGDAGGDTILAGLGSDQIFGGDGADRIVVGSGSAIIDPGPGADRISVSRISGDPQFSNVTINNADTDDSLFWNGYRLTGGVLSLVEAEGEWDLFGYLKGGGSPDGVCYTLSRAETGLNLLIATPDGRSTWVAGWQQGMLGINLTGGDQFSPPYPLPQSNICYDGKYLGINEGFDSLSGAARVLATPGPNVAPSYPAPAQAAPQPSAFEDGDTQPAHASAGVWLGHGDLLAFGDAHLCLA